MDPCFVINLIWDNPMQKTKQNKTKKEQNKNENL